MSQGQKISSFTVNNAIDDSALLTFVQSGTNFTITYSDFKTELGVTGTLVSIGDPLATPVLAVDGTEYQIRNIESGAGIITSVSPENGVSIDWNVAQDSEGVSLTSGLTNAQPVISSLVAGLGVSITKVDDEITFKTTQDPATGLANRIVVTQASDLAGALDSTKEYFIDGVVDMGTQMIEVPAGGLNLSGYNFDVSKLISSADGYTMFTSPVGGSGNVLGKDYAIEVTGVGSKVYALVSNTGFNAFEFARVNFNDCSSLGSIENYRQGLEVGTGRFGGKPELELIGTWLGGYFIDTSIVRNMVDGVYSLFKAGAGFSMASRFRSNQNIDLPASASFFDFAPSNFVNPSTLQIDGAIITRDGVFDAIDSNITPNITEANLVSNWVGNNGMPNTFTGGFVGVTTEAATAISGTGAYVDIDATLWSVSDLQHFDSPVGGQLRHLGNTPREFKVVADLVADSTSGNVLTVRVVKWDDSASVFSTVLDQSRQVNSLVGGRDVAFFGININTTLDQNDYIKLQVANQTATNDITVEADSYFIVETR